MRSSMWFFHTALQVRSARYDCDVRLHNSCTPRSSTTGRLTVAVLLEPPNMKVPDTHYHIDRYDVVTLTFGNRDEEDTTTQQ